jgi:hypothetical protein
MKRGMKQRTTTREHFKFAAVFICLSAVLTVSGRASEPVKPVKACGLLTTSEAGAIIGGPVGQPEEKSREFRSQKSWMSTCTWYCQSKGISVAITLTPISSGMTSEKAYGQYVAGMEKSLGIQYKLAPVAGVGEKAGWDGDMKQLIAFRKPVQMVLSVSGSKIAEEAALDLSRKIAVRMLERIGEK